jgi:hypothetical protein
VSVVVPVDGCDIAGGADAGWPGVYAPVPVVPAAGPEVPGVELYNELLPETPDGVVCSSVVPVVVSDGVWGYGRTVARFNTSGILGESSSGSSANCQC